MVFRIVSILIAFLFVSTPFANNRIPHRLEDIVEILGFKSNAGQELRDKNIITQELKPKTSEELSIQAAMLLSEPLDQLVKLINNNQLFQLNKNVIDFKEIKPGVNEEDAFNSISFSNNEKGEVKRFLEEDSYKKIHLSQQELNKFQILQKPENLLFYTPNSSMIDKVEKVYRTILRKRFLDYYQKGINGIEPYWCGEGVDVINPSKELRLAVKEASLIKKYWPEFYHAWLDYPKEKNKKCLDQFFWTKQRINNRPAFLLCHRYGNYEEDCMILAEREYYVGHSYNCMQVICGCLSIENKTLVIYRNRTFTQKVAGFASGIARAVAIHTMKDEIITYFQKLRDVINESEE